MTHEVPDERRCELITWTGLPDGTTTPRVHCARPGTVVWHLDTSQPGEPRIEEDTLCAEHYQTMYGCEFCGEFKGTWRGQLCAACQAVEDAL